MMKLAAAAVVAAALTTSAHAAGPIPPNFKIMVSTGGTCREADLCIDTGDLGNPGDPGPIICSMGQCHSIPHDACISEDITRAHECLPGGNGFPYDAVPWDDINSYIP